MECNHQFSGSIPGRILRAGQVGGLDIVLSQHILGELVRVLRRLPKVEFTPIQIRSLAESFRLRAEIAEPDGELDTDLRDPDDQLVLATLRVSKAKYLITGDKDLLALAGKYPIITPAAFWDRHG